MDKFLNKYRIPSNRRPNWDYSDDGAYFITLVTQNRICNLGTIVEMHGRASLRGRASLQLSDFGLIVKNEWEKSFGLRNELFVDEYIIMPNHIHAIIILDKNETHATNVETAMNPLNTANGVNGAAVETHGRASLRPNRPDQSDRPNPSNCPNPSAFIRKPQSISSFIAGFKSAVNSKIDDFIDENNLNISKYNRNNHFFQSNFHDHIIRNSTELERIQNYILNNPMNWKDDKFYS
jgi:REP element-mobilizing transposase RayT